MDGRRALPSRRIDTDAAPGGTLYYRVLSGLFIPNPQGSSPLISGHRDGGGEGESAKGQAGADLGTAGRPRDDSASVPPRLLSRSRCTMHGRPQKSESFVTIAGHVWVQAKTGRRAVFSTNMGGKPVNVRKNNLAHPPRSAPSPGLRSGFPPRGREPGLDGAGRGLE